MKNSTDVGVGAPHCNVYAKAIPLEDALEDSPMFRKKLKDREAEVEEFASGIKKIIKSSKNYLSAANAYAESFKDFITEIANFKNRMDVNDETLDTGFMHFISGLRDIATFQEFLGSQMEGLISAPLQEFVNTDVKQVKQSYKQYEKSISNLDSVVSKLGQVKKKNADKLSELSADVEEAKRAHRGACLDVTLGFNKVLAKKRFEFLERVCVYIQAQSTFFHQGYQFFTDNEPKIKDYSFYLQSTRKKFEDDTKDFESQKAHLIDENPLQRVASPSMPHILMRGYLFKRSDDVININTWIRRYFVLKEGHLCYYKTGNEEQPDLNLNLLLCSVKLRPDMERRNCFEIVSPPDRSLILQAESDELMNQWISEIQKSISNSLNAQPTPSSEERKKQNSKLHLDEGEKETPLARLRALSPANCVCADCDSKDPDWASFNLGVLLCIDCSGVHRSLGVHISKVRSLSLDQWEPDLMEMMCGLGNEFVNSIYEANIPEDRTKPASTDSREMKNKWIRDKYEKKLFVKGFVPSVENADENAIKAEKCKLLFSAIKAGDIKKVFELIVQGVDLSYQNPEDEMHSPAHAAIAVNSPAILILMLMNNAVPDLKDTKGWTPLHLAADKGLANCAVLLLQKNTIHALAMTDNEGLTPLQIAMKVGSADCVTLLRLAQLARDEGATALEESFADALRQFSRDTRAK